jgi:hypothetical protein
MPVGDEPLDKMLVESYRFVLKHFGDATIICLIHECMQHQHDDQPELRYAVMTEQERRSGLSTGD